MSSRFPATIVFLKLIERAEKTAFQFVPGGCRGGGHLRITQLRDQIQAGAIESRGRLRLFAVQAQDNRLREKLEEQLCLQREPISQLFADAVVTV